MRKTTLWISAAINKLINTVKSVIPWVVMPRTSEETWPSESKPTEKIGRSRLALRPCTGRRGNRRSTVYILNIRSVLFSFSNWLYLHCLSFPLWQANSSKYLLLFHVFMFSVMFCTSLILVPIRNNIINVILTFATTNKMSNFANLISLFHIHDNKLAAYVFNWYLVLWVVFQRLHSGLKTLCVL
jgi:hypothetical protein